MSVSARIEKSIGFHVPLQVSECSDKPSYHVVLFGNLCLPVIHYPPITRRGGRLEGRLVCTSKRLEYAYHCLLSCCCWRNGV